MAVLSFFGSQVFGQPAFLFGLIALVGLLVGRRPFEDIVLGVVKTMIGYLILIAGANLLTNVITPISGWLSIILRVQGIQPTLWAVLSSGMKDYGAMIGIALLIGFVSNLILARITPLKGVSVTGHIMLLFAAWVTVFLVGHGFSGVSLAITSGIICALQYWLTPSIIRFFMKAKITDEWSLYMPNVSGIVLSSWLGSRIGKPEDSIEDISFPAKLSWARDSIVSIAVFGSLIWVVLGLIAGKQAVIKYSADQNWIIYLIMVGVQFSAAVVIILHGVRMLLAEIVPAFQSISEKVIPGAILGLDYPTVFTFSPVAMFVGFFSKLAGAIVGTLLEIAFRLPVIILPSVFQDFWDGALIGVFANKFGGKKAAIILPFVLGIIIQLVWALSYRYTGQYLIGHLLAEDYPDTGFLTLILGPILRLFGR